MSWKKPQGPVKAKKGRFVAPYFRDATDIIGNAPGSLNGTAAFHRDGVRRTGTGYDDGSVSYSDNDALFGTGKHTVFMQVEFESDPGTWIGHKDMVAEKPYTSLAEPYYVFQIARFREEGSANGQFGVQFNNSGVRSFITLTNKAVAGVYTIVFCNESGRQEIKVYNDRGELFDSGSDTNSGAVTNYATDFTLLNTFVTTAVYAGPVVVRLAGVDNRAWSDAEMEAFGRDPFNYVLDTGSPILAGNTQRRYFGGAVVRNGFIDG